MHEDVCKCAVIYSLDQNRFKTRELLCSFDWRHVSEPLLHIVWLEMIPVFISDHTVLLITIIYDTMDNCGMVAFSGETVTVHIYYICVCVQVSAAELSWS